MFKHSRRLLLLVPLTLLGAALLVLSRRPWPHSAADDWLWQQAEKTSCVTVAGNSEIITVTDRQGIRSLLRSLQVTSPFLPMQAKQTSRLPPVVFHLAINQPESKPVNLFLIKTATGYELQRRELRNSATIAPQSIVHFRQALSVARTKSQGKQLGYSWLDFRLGAG